MAPTEANAEDAEEVVGVRSPSWITLRDPLILFSVQITGWEANRSSAIAVIWSRSSRSRNQRAGRAPSPSRAPSNCPTSAPVVSESPSWFTAILVAESKSAATLAQ